MILGIIHVGKLSSVVELNEVNGQQIFVYQNNALVDEFWLQDASCLPKVTLHCSENIVVANVGDREYVAALEL